MKHRRTKWTLDSGEKIMLITPEEYRKLPDGTVLTSIFGVNKVKGKDYIDQDTRGDFLAFGFNPNPTEERKA